MAAGVLGGTDSDAGGVGDGVAFGVALGATVGPTDTDGEGWRLIVAPGLSGLVGEPQAVARSTIANARAEPIRPASRFS